MFTTLSTHILFLFMCVPPSSEKAVNLHKSYLFDFPSDIHVVCNYDKSKHKCNTTDCTSPLRPFRAPRHLDKMSPHQLRHLLERSHLIYKVCRVVFTQTLLSRVLTLDPVKPNAVFLVLFLWFWLSGPLTP